MPGQGAGRHRVGGCSEHAPDRQRSHRLGQVQVERRRQRGERQLVDAHRTGERMLHDLVDQLDAPEQQPGLWATQQFVSAARH